MFGKIQITGILEVKTGMHIGTSDAFAAIGAIDSPVIRDAATKLPIIPGSSLKGKLRTLLAKQYNPVSLEIRTPDDDVQEIVNLFGRKADKEKKAKTSRLIFSDMILANYKALSNLVTEVKFENTIDRLTAIANPRQIERVIRGARFELDIIYDVEPDADITADFQMLVDGLKLLEYDYLGGNGTRGYGKVKFADLQASAVAGEVDDAIIDKCNEILATV